MTKTDVISLIIMLIGFAVFALALYDKENPR